MSSSKKCCLRQHDRRGAPSLKFIDLSLDDTVLKYLLRGPNLLDSHIEEDCELYQIADVTPEFGSLAILHTQNGFVFLQALSSDVYVESLGCNFDGNSAHGGIKVRPCTTGTVSTLQILPGQSFYLGKTTLSLVPQEYDHLPADSSSLPDSDFEHYHHQGSQIGTPQTARLGSTVVETPMLHRDHESEQLTPMVKQVTEQAMSEMEDIKAWPGNAPKSKTMQTVRGASDHGHFSSQPKLGRSECVANAATSEPDRSSPRLHVQTEDKDMVNATAVRLLKQTVVDLEDMEMAGADIETEMVEKLEPSSSIESRVHLEEEPGHSSRSLILEKSKPLSSPLARAGTFPEQPISCEGLVPQLPGALIDSPTLTTSKPWSLSLARVEAERGAASDQSAIREISPSDPQPDGDSPVRKKAKTAAVPNEDLIEESQNSLQRELVSVEIRMPTKTDRLISADQTPSTFAAPATNNKRPSSSATQPKQRSSTATNRSKRVDSTIASDSRHHSANERPSDFSFNATGSNPPTDWDTTSAPPSISASPYSSMRSTRSAARDEHDRLSSSNTGMRIVFASSSSAGSSKPFLKFLSKKGVKVVQSVHDCTVLCVGKELKKTSKLILAVVLGKDIITESWATDSVKGDDLLSLVPYMPRDPKTEGDWGISLDQAIFRGKEGLKVLQNQIILFTPSAKKERGKNGFDELKEIVKYAGAKDVASVLPKTTPEETSSSTIAVAKQGSPEVAELQKLGWRVLKS